MDPLLLGSLTLLSAVIIAALVFLVHRYQHSTNVRNDGTLLTD